MTTTISPESVIGKVKTIGESGPLYQVVKPLRTIDDNDVMMEVVFLESGEVSEYPLSGIELDPEAE